MMPLPARARFLDDVPVLALDDEPRDLVVVAEPHLRDLDDALARFRDRRMQQRARQAAASAQMPLRGEVLPHARRVGGDAQ